MGWLNDITNSMDMCANMLSHVSHVQLSATPWTVAHLASLSMGSPRQEYWSGLPFPPAGDLPDSGIEPTSPMSPALQVDSLPADPSGKPQISQMPGYCNFK